MKTEVGLPIVMRLDDGMTTAVSSPAAEKLEYLILLTIWYATKPKISLRNELQNIYRNFQAACLACKLKPGKLFVHSIEERNTTAFRLKK